MAFVISLRLAGLAVSMPSFGPATPRPGRPPRHPRASCVRIKAKAGPAGLAAVSRGPWGAAVGGPGRGGPGKPSRRKKGNPQHTAAFRKLRLRHSCTCRQRVGDDPTPALRAPGDRGLVVGGGGTRIRAALAKLHTAKGWAARWTASPHRGRHQWHRGAGAIYRHLFPRIRMGGRNPRA